MQDWNLSSKVHVMICFFQNSVVNKTVTVSNQCRLMTKVSVGGLRASHGLI